MSTPQYYDESKSHYGYPAPGQQDVTAEDIMNSNYFMTDKEWDENRKCGNFDYVIVGSSFCASAFTTQALKNNPDAKILIIERGAYLLPDHYQNLPPAVQATVFEPSETFHWSTTQKTNSGEYIRGLHGAYSFFGGRSSFWSGWCPQPSEDEMEGWPRELVKVVQEYFPEAKKLLNVVTADQIFQTSNAHHQPIFGKLQQEVHSKITQACGGIKAVKEVIHAPLAVKAKMQRYTHYSKYSVVGSLLHLLQTSKVSMTNQEQQAERKLPSLQAVTNCLVKKIEHDNKGRATKLETSKGEVILGDAKVVLAMGILPSTTLVLNSFPASLYPKLGHVGKRFTAHFISSITARAPLTKILMPGSCHDELELGAVYIAGEDKETSQQFHVQLTAIKDKAPETSVHDRMQHLPDVLASPSVEQLQTSKDHVIFVCACLGELDLKNEENWFKLGDSYDDITCNCQLQVVANATDNALWTTMDDSTFQLLENIVSLKDGLEYWHQTEGTWKASRPMPKLYRHDGLVHEASTMWIGGDDDIKAPVGLDYRLRGVDNVYITGASLWPRGGSWNPVGTIVSMAMHLADQICKRL